MIKEGEDLGGEGLGGEDRFLCIEGRSGGMMRMVMRVWGGGDKIMVGGKVDK
ncbi:hypothetical protein [Bacillus pumilus]|uniref:hypothetical protein n=1 Tax=Bacillus pumilus TaxID=1408 RepID=UPI0016428F4B|nr:hypothetical protein [Bacillus pumilus]